MAADPVVTLRRVVRYWQHTTVKWFFDDRAPKPNNIGMLIYFRKMALRYTWGHVIYSSGPLSMISDVSFRARGEARKNKWCAPLRWHASCVLFSILAELVLYKRKDSALLLSLPRMCHSTE